ncbi:TetR/AcrR family transcriptional regulator [Microbacterium natoriense]|uniref:TetR/AcrR family transcriptional regulator n=1 Tax=Microbacterium natoriense TaxID=284570 RepID=UPI00358F1A31
MSEQMRRRLVRSDARHNREHIALIARKAISDDPHVSYNVIAQKAGVGAGTLYRHFPSRTDLLRHVYRDDIAQLRAHAERALMRSGRSDALRNWVLEIGDLVRRVPGLGDVIVADTRGGRTGPMCDEIMLTIDMLLNRHNGNHRPAVQGGVFLLLLSRAWNARDAMGGTAQANRLLETLLGLVSD